jgi:hypothetical protein
MGNGICDVSVEDSGKGLEPDAALQMIAGNGVRAAIVETNLTKTEFSRARHASSYL